MIQCKYCGATAAWPIDVKHREECVPVPKGAYLEDLFQEVETEVVISHAGGDSAGNTWWSCGKHGTKGGTATGVLLCPECWPNGGGSGSAIGSVGPRGTMIKGNASGVAIVPTERRTGKDRRK